MTTLTAKGKLLTSMRTADFREIQRMETKYDALFHLAFLSS
jgi:hypothetical protein